jgi:hypothetical protein
MSIERFGDIFSLTCDICGEDHPETFYDFGDAVQAKKDDGWKSRRDKDGCWEDVCPDCQENEAGKDFR